MRCCPAPISRQHARLDLKAQVSLFLLPAPGRERLPRDSLFCLKLCNINTYFCVSGGICASAGRRAPKEEVASAAGHLPCTPDSGLISGHPTLHITDPEPRWFPEWGKGHPGHCSVLVSISGLHLLSISGIYPPVVTMTGVPRPSLQELLPDELMHMVQRDLLPPGLGQVSQRARELGGGVPNLQRAPAKATSSPSPTQSPQSRPTQLRAARRGRACCLLGREHSVFPAVLFENKRRQLSLGVM